MATIVTMRRSRSYERNWEQPVIRLITWPFRRVSSTMSSRLGKKLCADGARVVVEKPFGHNLETARELNATIHKVFPESAVFRIDHYLGKRAVRSLVIFASISDRRAGMEPQHVECVQITMAEDFGIAGRGKFYDETGAIRDVIQNHLFQVLGVSRDGAAQPPYSTRCATNR